MKTMSRYLTRDEEARLFKRLRERAGRENASQLIALRDLHLFKLLRHTGIRVNAATHIQCADARSAIAGKYLQRRCDKGGRNGKSLCNSKAIAALKGLLLVRRLLGFSESDEARLVVSRQGARISARAIQKRMKVWCADAGLAVSASPHWWRHTKAMRVMVDSTARDPRGVVQELLDHSSFESTVIYTRPSREEVEQINEEVG